MPLVRFLVLGVAKVLSKAFGLATMTFFGRMPTRDADEMAIVALLSLTWLVAVAGIVVPDLGGTLPGMPRDDLSRRLVAGGAAMILPAVNGAIVSRLHNRPGGALDTLVQLAAGYVHTVIIGAVVVGTVVSVPVIKADYVLRRFTTQHLMVMIPEGAYDDAYEHVIDLLEQHDAAPERARANPLVRGLFRGLTFVIERIFRRRVASEMRVIRGELGDGGWYEITVHATDITILGRDRATSLLLPLLADELDERVLYFTWDDDSQQIENRMRACRQRLAEGENVDPGEVVELVEGLRGLELDKEEWDAVRRNLYRLERDIYRQQLDHAPGHDAGDAPTHARSPSARREPGYGRDVGPTEAARDADDHSGRASAR